MVGLTIGLLATTIVVADSGDAAEPARGPLSPSAPTFTWTGDVSGGSGFTFCELGEADPQCDVVVVTVDPGPDRMALDVSVAGDDGSTDIDLTILAEDGTYLDGSYSEESEEHVTIYPITAGVYRLQVDGYYAPPFTTYKGTASLRTGPPPDPTADGPESVLWDHEGDELQATAEVPLRVVAVGFEPGELDERKVFADVPDRQRPGVLIPYDYAGESPDDTTEVSGWATVNHQRRYYRKTQPFLLPIEMRWKPELVYAPPTFTAGLFDAMAESMTFGPRGRPQYLERYNAARGGYRVAAGGDAVAPGSDVAFVDAERTEDWIAAHGEEHLGFHVGKDAGEAGFTVFLLNTWDAPEAAGRFPSDRYHNFLISRPDPDTGNERGVDWARLWGGRYRFLMIDLGAAPNSWEAETRDAVVHGSAAYDPPLWEFRARAPRPVTAAGFGDSREQAVTPGATWDDDQLHASIARTVNEAASFRFLHSYLYEPRPGVGRFYLSDNVWQDSGVVIPSTLEKLYDQSTVLAGLRSLLPYLDFGGDVVFEELADQAGHPEYAADQAALDQAKADGGHEAMSTRTIMDYLDAHPERFLRGGPCATKIPTIQVVAPGHYAWYSATTSGQATQREGRPWGFVSSVNDVTKWGGADRDETLAHVHRPSIFDGTFTYLAIHETSHYLGLAHPHDTIGAARNPDGSPLYYDGFAWTYDSTAAPTTYSHHELTYNVLDQETIARGHVAHYLSWVDDALHDGGVAFHRSGRKTIGQLPAQARLLRRLALERTANAERQFASFDFVAAASEARQAWAAAANYLDLALNKPIGTAESEKGGGAPTACLKASVPAIVASGTMPATGGDSPAIPLLLLAIGLTLLRRARLRLR